jgi:DNA repair photolyase
MKIKETTCKTALSRSGIYGWQFTINPYRGCEHSCKYCYAPNIIRVPRSAWGSFVEVKKNIPTILSKELKRTKPGLVGISSVTDPYQPLEEKYRVTRYCLEQLLKNNFPISIITKSPLILRDIDLLKKFSHSEITISISTLDVNLSRLIEPKAPTIGQRLDALTKLSSEGFNTYAFLGPLLPILDVDEIPGLIHRIGETGVRTVMVDSLNLKPGIWNDMNRALKNEPKIRDIFEQRLFSEKKYYETMFNIIKIECENLKINFEV